MVSNMTELSEDRQTAFDKVFEMLETHGGKLSILAHHAFFPLKTSYVVSDPDKARTVIGNMAYHRVDIDPLSVADSSKEKSFGFREVAHEGIVYQV